MNQVVPTSVWARQLAERVGDVPTMQIEEAVDTRSQADLLHQYLKRRGEKIPERHIAASLVVDLERRIGQLLEGVDRQRVPGLTPPLVKVARRFARVSDENWEVLKIELLDGSGFREVTSTALMKALNRRDKIEEVERIRSRSADLVASRTSTIVTLVADPPWEYGNAGTRNAAAWQYPTMTEEEICDLGDELRPLLADDAHLYLWATNTLMREAQRVLDAWGFTQKTILTWVKPNMGLGNYFRSTTEHVLFGTRGHLPTLTDSTRTHFFGDMRGHSTKPTELLELVERNSPPPWFEMFARGEMREGWQTWGKETAS